MFRFTRKVQAQPIAQPRPIADLVIDTQAKFRMHRIRVRVLDRNEVSQSLTVAYLERPFIVSYSDVVYDFGDEAWVVTYAVTSQERY